MEVLPREGCPVHLAYLYGTPEATALESGRISWLGFTNMWDIQSLFRLRRFVREQGITHILATLEQSSIVARLLGWIAWDVRIVISEPGMANRKPLFYKCLDVLLNIRTDVLVAGSEKVRESLLTYEPFYSYKILTILNGVVVPVPPRVHTPEKIFTVLAVGSLREEKGFNYLIEAFKIFLEDTRLAAQLVIIGGGKLEQVLKQQAQSLGISDSVQFLGELGFEETRAWYLRAHCFALSSVSEGGPLVTLEAMAEGLPVVSTRVGQMPETIMDGVSGLLVNPRSSTELAAALRRISTDEALYTKLARGGYERVRDHFSFNQHVQQLRTVLRV